MSEPRIDPERLAAFLDGTATAADREQVLSTIASSREAYAEFREVEAIRGELHGGVSPGAEVSEATMRTRASAETNTVASNGEAVSTATARVGTTASPTPSMPGAPELRAKRNQFAIPLSMLAVAAGLAVVFSSRLNVVKPEASVVAVAQSMRVSGAAGSGSLARLLGADWDTPGWTVTRGAETERPPDARAFRLGVRFAQLEIAINANDTVAVGVAARAVQTLLSDVSGSGPLSSQLDLLRTTPTTIAADARSVLATEVGTLLGEDGWFALGVWVGSAQVAARVGDARFFALKGPGMRALVSISSLPTTLNAEGWAAATSTLQRLTGASPLDAAERERINVTLTGVLRSASSQR
jgi:hypothetical protein